MLKQALIVLSLFSLLTTHALLAEPQKSIGMVILTSGTVEATGKDAATRPLTRKSELFEGDTVKVSPAGKAQIKFTDSSLMTLQEKTEFRVDTYQNEGKDSDKFAGSLVKGGFRTLTGAIGKASKDSYNVKTPVAVMGVRGTEYEGRFDPESEKLIVACYKGVCIVENEDGAMEIGLDQRFNVCEVEAEAAPEGLLADPFTAEEEAELASAEAPKGIVGAEPGEEPGEALEEGEVEVLSNSDFADIEADFENQNLYDEETAFQEYEFEDLQTELHEECVGHECDQTDDDPTND